MARIVLLISLWVLPVWAGGERVLVVYNTLERESQPLAEYYARVRGVPTNQLCAIRVRNAETITRREFNEQVRTPIVRFMVDRGLLFRLGSKPETVDNKITYVALIYGVPLRIENDPSIPGNAIKRNEAAVDSELTLLPTEGAPVVASISNPFFNRRMTEFDALLNCGMVLVSRLDGPDPGIVRRMIDDAVATERTGLKGKCYIDAQNKQDAAYAEGDTWINDAGNLCRAAGIETIFEETSAMFGEDFVMTNAAMYAGWYAPQCTGAFTRVDFKFRPGAVAYHLHSWSAGTLRSRTADWVGPFLAKGAAASFGNVYEPYLGLTPRVDLFFKRLLAGATFAEAGWYSEPVLSWQTTFVGDPLYRPFKKN